MGCIYIIKNTVNDKVYIGKTEYTAEIRFKRHIQLAYSGTTELYISMRSIGTDKFYVETLEECDNNLLNEREQYWIYKYNSFNNGYNSTTGGSAGNKIDTSVLEQLISDGKTKDEISKELGIRKESLCKIHNFDNNPSKMEYTNVKKCIDMYSKEYEFIRTFESVREAYINFNTAGLCNNKCNFYSRVKQSCEIDCLAFGYRWRRHGEVYLEHKNNTKSHTCVNCGIKISYNAKLCRKCYNERISSKIKRYEKTKKVVQEHRCSNCGIKISTNAKLCKQCYNIQKESNIPDIQTLQQLISEYSYEDIGRMYNVTGKAVRKWADRYNLVESRLMDRTGVTCVELNIHFNTFKEAAEYLIQNGLTRAGAVATLGYRIGQAKKNKIKYQNFHWI